MRSRVFSFISPDVVHIAVPIHILFVSSMPLFELWLMIGNVRCQDGPDMFYGVHVTALGGGLLMCNTQKQNVSWK